MLQDRKDDMRSLATALREELKHFEGFGVNKELNKEIFRPIRNRLNGTPLRAYFSQKMFLIIQDRLGWNKKIYGIGNKQSELFLIKIPFVFELIITIQYLHNQILDKKDGVTSSESITHNILTANLLKDYLYDYIENNFPEELESKLTKTVRQAFKLVDIGQLMEKQHNTYQRFTRPELIEEYNFSDSIDQFICFEGLDTFMNQLQKDLPREHWAFTELYLKRIFLTCAALFILITDFLCEVLGLSIEDKAGLMKFAVAYGLMRQLINDNADFVPSFFQLSTLSKSPEDAFSDLKNRNITLPLIYHLAENPNSPIAAWLSGGQEVLTPEQEKSFAQLLRSDHSIFKSIQLSRLLATIADTSLKATCEASVLLADTSRIAWWNKFLSPVIKTTEYRQFKKTGYYKRMKKMIGQTAEWEHTPNFILNIKSEKNPVLWSLLLNYGKPLSE